MQDATKRRLESVINETSARDEFTKKMESTLGFAIKWCEGAVVEEHYTAFARKLLAFMEGAHTDVRADLENALDRQVKTLIMYAGQGASHSTSMFANAVEQAEMRSVQQCISLIRDVAKAEGVELESHISTNV